MITNSVNNVNFGMARVKGAFRKLEIDALMEAYKKGSDALSLIENKVDTIGRCMDGDVFLKKDGPAQYITLSKTPGFFARLRGERPFETILYVVNRDADTPASIVTAVANQIRRLHDLYNVKAHNYEEATIRKGHQRYVDSVNALYSSERTKKILDAIHKAG